MTKNKQHLLLIYKKSTHRFSLPYMVMNRHDWSENQSKSTITRASRLDAVPRTWAEDDDDLWHPKPSNVPANGDTKVT